MRFLMIAAGATLLAACGGSGPQKAQADTAATALEPGEYELTWTGFDVQPADKGKTVDGKLASSDAFAKRACIGADGSIGASALSAKTDQCNADQSYVRNGLVNAQFSCTRKGSGPLVDLASGSFTANSFDVEVDTSTSFDSAANYRMTRKVSGKKVGECPASSEDKKES